MIITEAIYKSFEKGYKDGLIIGRRVEGASPGAYAGELASRYLEITLLDSFFWQSLGKALEWSKVIWCDTCGTHLIEKFDTEGIPEWRYHWHRFIDHLAENKSVESFFESLQ